VLLNTFLTFTIAFGMGWTYIVMVASEVIKDLGLTIVAWGTLWSAVSLGALLFAIIGGALGDRFGIRPIAGLGIVLMGTLLLLRATATGFATMYVWMFLFGAVLSLTFPNVPKALGMWFPPEEFGLANGITLAGYGSGAALAGLFSPMLLKLLGGWRGLTLLFGILSIVLGIFWLLTVRDRPQAAGSENQVGLIEAMSQVLKVRDVWLLAGCYLFLLGGYIGFIGYAPTYFATVRGMTPAATGVVISGFLWAAVVGTFLLPTLSDRVGLRKIFYFPGILANGIFVVLMAYTLGASLWMATLLAGFVAGAGAIAFVVPLEMEGVGPVLAGSAVGVAATAGNLGGFISPIIGMRLVNAEPTAGFIFWGGCYVLSALLFLLIKETGPKVQKV
jgi:NNP family nitrate/nitrite transporter-like MFS transporter